ncbi:recombinase D [Candidatus Magnetoovum chiemensis]|nr:recombinase D [Candidatus Magnetoovum chiemensis]
MIKYIMLFSLTNDSLIELQGQVERITFFNEDNAYTIARLKVNGYKDLVTIVGNIAAINPGEILKLKGFWDKHPKYGEQFKIHSCESLVPATVKGIEKYLGSGLIKGIGPVFAKKLVDKFGDKTLDIIANENTIERLREIDGIGQKRVEMIKTAWIEQKEIKDLMLFLQNYDISSSYAAKIYKYYGKDAVRIVKKDPYKLTEIYGIGFISADKVAEKLGIPSDAPQRAQAAILYALQQLAEKGHVYCPYEKLIVFCTEELKLNRTDKLQLKREHIVKAVSDVEIAKKIAIEDLNENRIIQNNKAVYLTKFYVSETGVSSNLKTLMSSPKNLRNFDEDKALEWVQQELAINLAPMQITAVRASIKNKIMVITGGPGTGKTTIIKCIISIYKKLNQRIALAAPTGRASRKLQEASDYEAKTIHRLLEFTPKDGKFKRNENNCLPADLVIVDEASMIDIILMHHFLKSIPTHATLILVGDVDQLPSVGAGDVLRDIISSNTVTTIKLNEIFRQASQSLIVVNAHKINNGESPIIPTNPADSNDFYFINIEEPQDIVNKIVDLCKDKLPRRYSFNPMKDIQVLSAMHKGTLGAQNLNIELQKALNPSKTEISRGGRIFKTGDKVMQTVNNYEKEVYNGDIGQVIKINHETQELTVNFYDRQIIYDFKDLDELVLAYAVSIHKSQGSEYNAVIIPIHTQHYIMLQRNLIYTAVTRGKKLIVLLGTKKALNIAINNNKQTERYSYLRQRLTSL